MLNRAPWLCSGCDRRHTARTFRAAALSFIAGAAFTAYFATRLAVWLYGGEVGP